MFARQLATLLLGICLIQGLSTSAILDADESQQVVQATDEESAVSDDQPQDDPAVEPNWNLPLKTIGRTQLWTDYIYRGGYRLQQHALTHHWRLLDADDVRRAWGTREQCVKVLDQRQPKLESDGNPRHAVVMLHGLMRTRGSMKPLEAKLKESGYPDTFRFSYASTRSSIGDHAAALREVLDDYPSDTKFSFIGHSMGNIVVRHLVSDLQRDGDPTQLLPRCKSMVMLGPPNHGSTISQRLAPTGLYGLVTGKGGMELGPEWESFVEKLATPPFPFAIIAGDVSNTLIQNPLVDGSSDFVVSVKEADLAGRQWLKTVPVVHSFLMSDPVVISMAIEFINEHP